MLEGYHLTEHGVLVQTRLFVGPTVYDQKYVQDRYDKYVTCEIISILRMRNIVAATGLRAGNALLDVGYGNGALLVAARHEGFTCSGYDISGYLLPDGIPAGHWRDKVDIVTFFDSFEHMGQPQQREILQTVKANYLVFSVPWFHQELGDKWFANWKHRRPDEHLSHFSPSGLCKMLAAYGFALVSLNNCEDRIRKPVDHLPNILTAVFRRG